MRIEISLNKPVIRLIGMLIVGLVSLVVISYVLGVLGNLFDSSPYLDEVTIISGGLVALFEIATWKLGTGHALIIWVYIIGLAMVMIGTARTGLGNSSDEEEKR